MDSTSVHQQFELPNHSREVAARLLTWIHYFSPPAILTFFLVIFIIRSVYASTPNNVKSNDQNGHKQLYGPGGKPLPSRRLTGLRRKQDKENDFPPQRKLVFQILCFAATLTFVASAIVIITHFWVSHWNYWCGQELVVSKMPYANPPPIF
jgi:hypothetical protein